MVSAVRAGDVYIAPIPGDNGEVKRRRVLVLDGTPDHLSVGCTGSAVTYSSAVTGRFGTFGRWLRCFDIVDRDHRRHCLRRIHGAPESLPYWERRETSTENPVLLREIVGSTATCPRHRSSPRGMARDAATSGSSITKWAYPHEARAGCCSPCACNAATAPDRIRHHVMGQRHAGYAGGPTAGTLRRDAPSVRWEGPTKVDRAISA